LAVRVIDTAVTASLPGWRMAADKAYDGDPQLAITAGHHLGYAQSAACS
jgi:hypothetical protein